VTTAARTVTAGHWKRPFPVAPTGASRAEALWPRIRSTATTSRVRWRPTSSLFGLLHYDQAASALALGFWVLAGLVLGLAYLLTDGLAIPVADRFGRNGREPGPPGMGSCQAPGPSDTVGCNCVPVIRRAFRRIPEMTYNRPYEGPT